MSSSYAIYGNAGLEKSALNAKTLWNGAKAVFHNGAWREVGKIADKRIASGKGGVISKGVKPVADFLSGQTGGLASAALAGYGLTAAVPGLDLPGNEFAMNVTTPILGLGMATPSILSAMRAKSDKGKAAIEGDVTAGSQAAVGDFMSGLNANPGMVQGKGNYRKFMEDNGIKFDQADAYAKNSYKDPMGMFKSVQNLLSDSQKNIGHETRRQIQNQLNKQAAIGGVLGKVGGGIGKVFKYGTPSLTAYGIYNAASRDKAHDEQAIQQEGYAATQVAIQKKMDSMSKMERFALKLDPTLAAQKMDDLVPGSIKRWEAQTGNTFQPGLIASTMNAWKKGGTPSFYETDAGGARHYVS
jgi:hypothetical protein